MSERKAGFSTSEWERVRQSYAAWWRGELDRPLVNLTVDDPAERDLSSFLTNWPQDLSDDEIVAAVEEKFSRQRFYGDAFPHFFVNYGPGVAAAFAGARVRPAPDTVWFEPAAHSRLTDLRIALDRKNPWWRRVRHVTDLLARRLGDRIQISISDIGGNMDILASLRGTHQLLLDVAEQPAEVGRCRAEITRTWLEVFDELYSLIQPHCAGCVPWAPTWAPGPTYMLQSDFSYMISPDMFKQFVLPDLNACCGRLEYAFYHLDGIGALPHLDDLLAIPNLHGIQWVPGAGKPPPSEWPEVLDRIRSAGKLVQLFCTPEEARKIIRRHGGKGFYLHISGSDATDASAPQLVRELGGMALSSP
jgi:5-methyltetrahydrofolate--homocysteine methyltransferase